MLLRFMVAAMVLAGTTAGAFAEEPSSSGTGFFVNSGGWLVTNKHVVDGCRRTAVDGYGEVKRVVRNPDIDLALLRVSNTGNIRPLALRAGPPKLGEDIVALGYPLPGFLSDAIKITTGNINSLAGIENDPLFLQVSAPIQPGNSGGPLLDRKGAVIGVTSKTVSKKLSDVIDFNVQNVNFALRIEAVRKFLSDEGIAFETADGDASELSTSEIAEKAAPGTVQVLCYGNEKAGNSQAEQEPVRTAPSAPSTGNSGVMRDAFGYDAIGFDYKTLRDVSYDQCKRQCGREGLCQAVTFNTRYNVCFLKQKAPVLVRNSDAASAYDTSLAADLLITDFSVYADTDAPGGDYARLREADFVGCTVACLMEDQCRAFAYVRKTKDCWLKDRIGAVRDMKGVEFGIK